MTKSQLQQEFLIGLLASGIIQRGEAMAKFVKKWRIGSRTFDRYWKKAQEQFKETQQAINKQKLEDYTKAELEAAKSNILSKQEKREYLRKIVHGEVTFEKFIVVKGEPKKVQVKADAIEILKAIDLDNKMAGDDAPIKNETLIKQEQPLFPDVHTNNSGK